MSYKQRMWSKMFDMMSIDERKQFAIDCFNIKNIDEYVENYVSSRQTRYQNKTDYMYKKLYRVTDSVGKMLDKVPDVPSPSLQLTNTITRLNVSAVILNH